MNWIISADINYFRVDKAFEKKEYVKWRQTANYSVGDIIYIYCIKPIQKVMFKTIVEKANMPFDETSDDREFFVNQDDYKSDRYERNMSLKLLQKINTEKLNLDNLQANGLKGRIQGPKRVKGQLNEYISSVFEQYSEENKFISTNKIFFYSTNTVDKEQHEKDVISIPASQTIDLIYKYRVHAHPNNYIRYPYKSVNYYTFREKDGWMKKIFVSENTISFNPQNTAKLDENTMDPQIKKRILGYIDERKKSMGFENEEYKFYVLSDSITLPKPVSLPKRNNHKYYGLSQLYNESEVQIEFIEDDEKIYRELDNRELKEGERIKRVIEGKKRNSKARQLKLESFKLRHGKVFCEVCEEEDIYALDVHHDNVQVSNMENGHITKISDLRVVCATCHRKIHGHNITVDELKNKLNN